MKKFKIYWTAASYLTIEAASKEAAEEWMRDTPLAEIRERSADATLEVEIEEVKE